MCDAVVHNQLLVDLETLHTNISRPYQRKAQISKTHSPQIPYALIQPRRKHTVHITKHRTLPRLEPQLPPHEIHNVLEALITRAREARLLELGRVGERRETDDDFGLREGAGGTEGLRGVAGEMLKDDGGGEGQGEVGVLFVLVGGR